MTLLRSSFIRMDPILELVDFNNQLIMDVTDRLIVDNSFIAKDSTALVGGTATFQLSSVEGFDFGRHMLSLSVVFSDLGPARFIPELVLTQSQPLSSGSGARFWNLRTANRWSGPLNNSPDTFIYQGVQFRPSRNFRVLRTGSPRAGLYPMREDIIPSNAEFVVREADSMRQVGPRLPVSAGGWSSLEFGFSLHWAQDEYYMQLVDNREYIVQIVIPEVSIAPNTTTYRMGNWIMQQPGVNLDHTDLVSVECQDVISLLDVPIGRSWYVDKGVNVGEALSALLEAQGLVGLNTNLPAIPYRTSNAPSWIVTENLSWLQIANEILRTTAHTNLFTDQRGTISTLPWRPITEFTPVWDFDSTESDSWIAAATELEPENEQVPNHWVAVVDDPDSDLYGRIAEARNTEASHPWSIPSQGGRIVTKVIAVNTPVLEEPEGPVVITEDELTLTVLQTIVKREAELDILRTSRLRIECGPVPHLWSSPVVRVHMPELGIVDRLGVVSEWRLPLDIANNDAYYLVDVG